MYKITWMQNGLNEYLGMPPIYYINLQVVNKFSFEIRYFQKRFNNYRGLAGEELYEAVKNYADKYERLILHRGYEYIDGDYRFKKRSGKIISYDLLIKMTDQHTGKFKPEYAHLKGGN